MECNGPHISIPMIDVLKAFADYKELHGTPPVAGNELTFHVNMPTTNYLQEVIKEYSFPLYSPRSFNDPLLELIEKGRNCNSSIIYDFIIYHHTHRIISQYLNNIPETTLQIGPGGSLGCEILLALMGVQQACTLDLCPRMDFDLDHFMKSLGTIFEIITWLKGIKHFDPSGLNIPPYQAVNGCYQIGDSIVKHFCPRAFENTDLEEESIDLLFSFSVLEHVRDPLKCIQETRRLLRPGGLTAHGIDLRDHRNFKKPLEFLRWSPDAWERIMEKYCEEDAGNYLNRWRANEFKAAFEQEGFSVLEYEVHTKVSDAEISAGMNHFHRDYRQFSKEDLAITGIFMVARKN